MSYAKPTPAELFDLRVRSEFARFARNGEENRNAEVILELVDAYERQPREDEETISRWAVETFGETGSNVAVAARANKEMAELLFKLAKADDDIEAAEEAADVVIVLARIFTRMGVRMRDAIDRKMQINRGRRWKLDGHGHGQHVPEPPIDVLDPSLNITVTHPLAVPYSDGI